MDLADLVGPAGIEKDAFGCGGLTRVNVGDDADVACQFEVSIGHISSFARLARSSYHR